MAKKMSIKKLEESINSSGGIDEFERERERHRRDTVYFDIHHQELLRDYKEEWVAVYDGRIVGHNKDFLRLIGKLGKEERHSSVIHHLTTKRVNWILARV